MGYLWAITVKLCMARTHIRLQTRTGQQTPLATLGVGIFLNQRKVGSKDYKQVRSVVPAEGKA